MILSIGIGKILVKPRQVPDIVVHLRIKCVRIRLEHTWLSTSRMQKYSGKICEVKIDLLVKRTFLMIL